MVFEWLSLAEMEMDQSRILCCRLPPATRRRRERYVRAINYFLGSCRVFHLFTCRAAFLRYIVLSLALTFIAPSHHACTIYKQLFIKNNLGGGRRQQALCRQPTAAESANFKRPRLPRENIDYDSNSDSTSTPA